jgi:hypothetical protein
MELYHFSLEMLRHKGSSVQTHAVGSYLDHTLDKEYECMLQWDVYNLSSDIII